MARPRRDYYATLGLGPAATEEEIRRTYRRLALKWHPDRNPGDARAEERFKEISEAYAVLMDPAKRGAYDRGAGDGGQGAGVSREDVFRDLFNDPRASAIFEEIGRELGRLGLRVERSDFERTLYGGRVVVRGGVFVVTPFTPVRLLWGLGRAALRGARAAEQAEAARALPARGGLLARAIEAGRRWLGRETGPTAVGRGDVTFPLRLTLAEAGAGARKRVTLRRADGDDEVVVTVPPGTRAGARLRLRGKGRPLGGGTRGDAYLVVEVATEG